MGRVDVRLPGELRYHGRYPAPSVTRTVVRYDLFAIGVAELGCCHLERTTVGSW